MAKKKRKKKTKAKKSELVKVEEERGAFTLQKLIEDLGGVTGRVLGTDVTPEDKDGNRLSFERVMATTTKVIFGKDGKPAQVEVRPEEWPPRGEKF